MMPLTRTGSPVTRSGFWVLGSRAFGDCRRDADRSDRQRCSFDSTGDSYDRCRAWAGWRVLRRHPRLGGQQWSGSDGWHTVSEIGVSSGRVIRAIGVGAVPSAVSSDGRGVWVANAGPDARPGPTVTEIRA